MRILILGVNLNGGVGTLRAHLVMGNSDEMILGGRGRRERGETGKRRLFPVERFVDD